MIRRRTFLGLFHYLVAEWRVGKVRWAAWSAQFDGFPESGWIGLLFECTEANAPAEVVELVRRRELS